MPSISTRGFIVRPTLDNTEPEAEPEFESLNVQTCSDPYSFTSDGVVTISGWNTPVSLDTGIPQLLAIPYLLVETTSSPVNE